MRWGEASWAGDQSGLCHGAMWLISAGHLAERRRCSPGVTGSEPPTDLAATATLRLPGPISERMGWGGDAGFAHFVALNISFNSLSLSFQLWQRRNASSSRWGWGWRS